MKEVIDLQGNQTQVSVDTPVRTEGGKHYLLPQAELDELAADIAAHEASASFRAIKREIRRLESEVTNRRLREAILGIDNGWLANQEALIAIERAKL